MKILTCLAPIENCCMSENPTSYSIPQWLLHSKIYSVVVIDMTGHYLFVNDCFRNRFSFLAKEFVGLNIQGTVHPDDWDACNEASMRCIQNPQSPQRVRIRKPANEAGDFYWTDWEFSPVLNAAAEATGILCVGYDITARKKTESRVAEQNEKLKEIAWQQSHQLRSPVVNILGCLQLIRNENKLVSEEEKDRLFEDIKQELSYLDSIIHKIVADSRATE